MDTSQIAGTIIGVTILVTLCIGCFITSQHESNRQNFNQNDWKIDKMSRPALLVRFMNSVGCGCGSNCAYVFLFYLIDKFVVQPALRKSLAQMAKAEEGGKIPAILCDASARKKMEQRLDEFKNDIKASQSLTAMSKVLNYAGAGLCLNNHKGLLKLAEEANQEKIVEPVFIVSLPRTGTTILHRTMALDRKKWRSFDMCDMVLPLPKPVARADEGSRKELANKAQNILSQADYIFPGYQASLETLHGFRAGEAEEDLGWFDSGLGHMMMDVLMLLYPEQRLKPGNISPLESKECAKYRYAWLHMIMQIYQKVDQDYMNHKSTTHSNDEEMGPSGILNNPWLMKDPNHAAYLPELISQFPDAKIVFTHRPPEDILASMAKLFVVFASVHHKPGAPGTSSKEWGQESLKRMVHYCNGMASFTKEMEGTDYGYNSDSNSLNRIDLRFINLVRDVPGAINQIYGQFYPNEPGPSEEAMTKFNAYLEENEREKKGNQKRSLEDFHLTKDEVESALLNYNEIFFKDSL